MANFSKALFESMVGKSFSVQVGDGQTMELLLVNISSRQISQHYESFVLNFDPPRGATPLPDGSYPMATEGFGPELIHISANHAGLPDPDAHYYESVFNVVVEENS